VVEWQACNPEVAGSRTANLKKQNPPEISGDCDVAWYCTGKYHALMAKMISWRKCFPGLGHCHLAAPSVSTGTHLPSCNSGGYPVTYDASLRFAAWFPPGLSLCLTGLRPAPLMKLKISVLYMVQVR